MQLQKFRPRSLIPLVGAVVFIGCTMALGWWRWQKDSQVSSLPQETVSDTDFGSLLGSLPTLPPSTTPTASPLARPTTTPVKPKVATPKPTVSPTSAPAVDITFTTNAGQVSRIYDDTNHGWQYQTMLSTSPYMIWPELSSFWSSYEDSCVDLTASQSIATKSVSIDIFIDGNKKLATTWGDQSGVPAQADAGSHHVVCYRTSQGVGVHTIKYILNGDRRVLESDFSNNEKTLTYEIKADNEAPRFVIAGPVKETEGTCLHLNEVLDNVSSYEQMTKQNRFDSDAWSDASNRLCITGAAGESHTYSAKVTDARGNTTEKSQTFAIQ